MQQIGPNNGQVNTSYDAMGRVSSQTNPFTAAGQAGPATSYQYDALGRVTIVTFPGNQGVQNIYSGDTITVIDQVNRKIKRESDGLGRLIKITEQDATGALAQETTYRHNMLDKLTAVNQGNQLRSFKYDSLGRLLYERIPEQAATINDGSGTYWTTKYTYTDFNAISTETDARGVITTYSYDQMNRPTGTSYYTANAPGVAPTPGVSFSYDNNNSSSTNGLLLSAGAGSYLESYSYDTFKRLSSVTLTIDGNNYLTGYQYGAGSMRSQITDPSGRVLNINRDSTGRLSSLTDQYSSNYLSGIGYNAAGGVTGLTLGNGVVEGYGYDANRLQITSQTAIKNGNTLLNLTYSYQASAGQNGAGTIAGNVGKLMSISGTINGATESVAYTYDLQGRLVTSNQTTNSVAAQRRFAYDRWGNRTGVWDALSGGNQIQSVTLQQSGGVPTNRISSVTSVSTVNYAYDAAGNVTNDGSHSYTYDAENRLVSVDGGSTAQYAYDQHNRRYKKMIGSTVTVYIWEGSQVLSEHDGSTTAVISEYIYSGNRMIAREQGGVRRYYLSDQLSERLTLDASGNAVGRQSHLPFGEEVAGANEQEKHHFTTYEQDSESGTDYAINRQYSQVAGRFMQVDPVSGLVNNPQSLNRYSYVSNDPINKTDPLGLIEPTSSTACTSGFVGSNACISCAQRVGDIITVTIVCNGASTYVPIYIPPRV